jgi:hypothetical protein
MAVPVLSHRLALGSGMRTDAAEQFLRRILESTKTPLKNLKEDLK